MFLDLDFEFLEMKKDFHYPQLLLPFSTLKIDPNIK